MRPFVMISARRELETAHECVAVKFTEAEANDLNIALARATFGARDLAATLGMMAAGVFGDDSAARLDAAIAAHHAEADRLAALHAKVLALLVEGKALS